MTSSIALRSAVLSVALFFAFILGGVTRVAALSGVILGGTLKARRWRLGATIAMVAVGAVVFRGLIALALRIGLSPIDLKLATAAFVLATLALPNLGIWRRRVEAAR